VVFFWGGGGLAATVAILFEDIPQKRAAGSTLGRQAVLCTLPCNFFPSLSENQFHKISVMTIIQIESLCHEITQDICC
jgi:hypothetical protein